MNKNFNVYDYLVFVAILLFTVSIGLYQGCKRLIMEKFLKKSANSKKKTDGIELNEFSAEKGAEMSEYLVASSSMNPLPVAFSLLASFFSATAILGMPAEVYTFGLQYWTMVLGQAIAPIIGAFATGPMFARLKLLSVFEYLKLRYDSNLVRLFGMFCYLIKTFISTSIFIYGPSTTLSYFTKLNPSIATGLIGFLGTFYT